MKTFLSALDSPSRRRFITGAARTFLGVSVLEHLGAPAAAWAVPGENTSKEKQVATARNVIFLNMVGGMSHLDTFDPKPGNEVMGTTEAIKTKADGIMISEYLPLIARHMDKIALVRSMNSTQGAHEQGQYYMRTSYTLRSTIRHPGMGAWLQKFQGKGNPALPGSVMVGNDSRHPGAGFFESKLSPLMVNSPEDGVQNVKMNSVLSEKSFNQSLKVAHQLDRKFVESYNLKNVRAYADMYQDALQMMRSEELKAFDLDDEQDPLKKRYGLGHFGQGCLLARRLVEHGVRHVEVTFGNWDTHNANFTKVPELCDELDAALSTLLSDLESRGLLQDTLVVLASEFGRTPEINTNEGRDHHPKAFTTLLAGGGIRGGQTYGESDERGFAVKDQPVTLPDFNATVAYALGLPLDQVLYSPSNRPFTVADKGKPLTSLFA